MARAPMEKAVNRSVRRVIQESATQPPVCASVRVVTVLAIVLRVTMEIPVRTRVIVSTDPVELPGPVYVIKAGQDHSVTVFVPPGVLLTKEHHPLPVHPPALSVCMADAMLTKKSVFVTQGILEPTVINLVRT